jgi:tRNA (cytidine/uridine-2'-O-)-methyltransferase
MSEPYTPRLHIVLYQPEIPYNAGSVGRTCVAVGAKLWMVRPLGFQVDDYYLRRAGLDYWEHLNWEAVDNWTTLVEKLRPHPSPAPQGEGIARFWYFTKHAQRSYTDVTYREGDVLVFGRESSGLPDEIMRLAPDAHLLVPMRPEVRCLNVSNTVAIVTYEALRQWNAASIAARD